MRWRIVPLLLLSVLPTMDLLAAPAPEPYAIVDIGPPPKGRSATGYYKAEIGHLGGPGGALDIAAGDAKVEKLQSVAALKKGEREWLRKNLRITKEDEGNRLKLTFQGGTRAEQVVILNTLLDVYIQYKKQKVQYYERGLRSDADCVLELEKRIKSGQHPGMVKTYRKGIEDLRTIHIPATRAEIARLKQIAIIRSAK